MVAHARFGPLLRRLRGGRGLSQERLAERAEVSARHLSFLENGRAAPSREMVLVLANALDVPLRERNTLLAAAGFAPVYEARGLDAAALAPIRRALDHLLAATEPFGAVVVDRDWNVLRMNGGATRMLAWALEGLTPPPEALSNVLLATTHPDALRSRIVNFAEVASALVAHVERELELEADDGRCARLRALLGSLPDPPRPPPAPLLPFLPLRIRKGDVELSLFTTMTTLGTPLDVTAQELRIESYFPADEATERFLRALA